jgi:hypothetical protein
MIKFLKTQTFFYGFEVTFHKCFKIGYIGIYYDGYQNCIWLGPVGISWCGFPFLTGVEILLEIWESKKKKIRKENKSK